VEPLVGDLSRRDAMKVATRLSSPKSWHEVPGETPKRGPSRRDGMKGFRARLSSVDYVCRHRSRTNARIKPSHQHLQPRGRGVQFGLRAILPHSNTPALRVAGFEDEDDDEDENEAPCEVARSSEGRRYRKQPKIDALRQYKEEILEAHRSGLSVHRIAQIFRERGVDISVPHLVRTVRRFVDEEERVAGRSPAPLRPTSHMAKEGHQESSPEATKPKAPVTYQVSEQPSTRVQEEEFAKQLRLARYLAAGGSPPSRPVEAVRQPRTPKPARAIAKAGAKTKAEAVRKKAREEELAKERRRAGLAGQKVPTSGSRRGQKERPSPGDRPPWSDCRE
jgi:hypothetical protein